MGTIRGLPWIVVLLLLPPLGSLAVHAQDGSPDPASEEKTRPAALVTFYPHVYGVGTNAPMPGNTQFPIGEDDFSRGTFIPCAGDVAPCTENGNNVLYVYSTAGFVHADFDTWNYADFHNERGQAKDVILDTTQDITATLYMSADAHAWLPSTVVPAEITPGVPTGMPVWNWDPGAHPDWQIEATLFLVTLGDYQGQASDAPPVDEKLASGDAAIVAQGVTEPMTMVSLDANVNGGKGEVYEFTVNLGKPQLERIPKEMDWVLRYRWWSSTNGQHYILPLSWNLNSGEFYPNRFTLPVRNAFDVELVYPQFLHDKLLVHAMLNSPWGSYDIDTRSVQIDIQDEGHRPVAMANANRVADFSVAHGGHYRPVNVTWVWDYQADKLPPGAYTATVTASNFQHSATAATAARFRVNPDGTGTVLSVGRSGQQTSSEAQLRALEGQGSGPHFAVEGAHPAPVKTATDEAPDMTPARETPAPGPVFLALIVAGAALVRARRRT